MKKQWGLTMNYDYECGLNQLRSQLSESDQEIISTFATLEDRLRRILINERKYGSSDSLDNQRSQAVDALNQFAVAQLGVDFVKFCFANEDNSISSLILLPPFKFAVETFPNFQGRTVELDWLNEWFSRVIVQQNSCTVLIRGQVGIGKSRLINTFAANLINDGKSYIVIREFGEELPPDQMVAQLAVDVFSQYRDLSSSSIPINALNKSVAAIASGKITETAVSAYETSIEMALWRLIGELAKEHPLVIVLESLQTAHPRLVRFFKMTARQKLPAPVLIIATIRNESVDHPSSVEAVVSKLKIPLKELKGLDKFETRGLVDSLCHPSALELDFHNKLYSSTRGNPYFTVEIINYLKQQNPPILRKNLTGQWICRSDIRDWSRWTPDNLIAFAQEQLNLLMVRNQKAGNDLKMAAMIGPRFLARLLQRLANYSDDEAEVFQQSIEAMDTQRLVKLEEPDNQILSSDKTYCFYSPVIQEALYEWDPQLHKAIAQLLGELYPDTKDQDRLRFWRAYHFQRAGDEQATIDFLQISIQDAAFKQQPFESVWLHEHLLRYSSQLQQHEVLNLHKNLATLYSELGRLEDAAEAYEKALEFAERQREWHIVVEIKTQLGWIRVKQEKYEVAEDLFEEAIKLLQTRPSLPIHLNVLVHRLYSGLFLERLTSRATGRRKQDIVKTQQYIREAQRYLEMCDLTNPDRKHDQALVLNNFGRLFKEAEQYEEAKDLFRRALEVIRTGATDRSSLESYMLNNLGVVANALDQTEEAIRWFEESLNITDREENVYLRTKSLLNLAEVYSKIKKYEQATLYATEGLWYARLLGHRTYQFDAYCNLGFAHFKLGRLDMARSYFEQAQELDPSDPYPQMMLKKIN